MTGQKNKQHQKPLNLNGEKLPAARANEQEGFYSRVLDAAEAIDFKEVSKIEGLDQEISLIRVKIKKLLEKDTDELKLIMQAANTLSKMVKIRYSMTKGQKHGLDEAIKNVINHINVPKGREMIAENLKLPPTSGPEVPLTP
jgi:hypothetical protein